MRSLSQTLKQNSPMSLAKEFVWRLQKERGRKQFLSRMERAACPAVFRNIPYYRPNVSAFTETSRALITGFADEICEGRYPFLGYGTADLGTCPKWNVDWISGLGWPNDVPLENRDCVRFDGSDVKAPYELSRLQFLPILGKAYVLTQDERYREASKDILSDWLAQNPVGFGVNWSIAMEAGLRGMSICFLLNLLYPFEPSEQVWLDSVTKLLWRHLAYIETHIEFSHLSRSNHYLSNIVALYCLSSFLDGDSLAAKRQRYRRLVEDEIVLQVYEDGGDYEASIGYQVLVAQMFTSALLLTEANDFRPSARFLTRLHSMHRLLSQLASDSGQVPQVGDCDDGRVELLLDDLKQMLLLPVSQRNSLRISSFLGLGRFLFREKHINNTDCAGEDAKWHGAAESVSTSVPSETAAASPQQDVVLFPQSGIAGVKTESAEVLFFAVPNSIGGKGSHSHNDKLSFVLRLDGEEVLTDSGTGTYTRDPELRNQLRVTGAHNTVVIDGAEQNTVSPDRPDIFRLGNEARVSPIECGAKKGVPYVRGSHKGYSAFGVTHFRTVYLYEKEKMVLVEDRFEGSGEHRFEINYQLASPWKASECEAENSIARCQVTGPRKLNISVHAPGSVRAGQLGSKISMTYGCTVPATRLRFSGEATFPASLTTRICWA